MSENKISQPTKTKTKTKTQKKGRHFRKNQKANKTKKQTNKYDITGPSSFTFITNSFVTYMYEIEFY